MDYSENVKHPFGEKYRDAHLTKIDQPQEILDKMLVWTKKPKHLFYFAGNVGNGKTYFAAAFYNYLVEIGRQHLVRVFLEEDFLSHLQRTISKGWDPHEEIDRICEIPYLILDDFGSAKTSEWNRSIFKSFINKRLVTNKPTIITSNLSRSELDEISETGTTSRIYAKENVVIETNGPDRRAE